MGYLDDVDEYGWNPQTGQTYSDIMGNVQWDNNGFLASPLSGTFTGGATGLAGAAGGIGNAIGNVKNALGDNVGGASWFGKSGILPTAFQGLSALGGLMQAYTGFKGLELAKQQAENAANAFRTQWQNNVASTGLAAENAARVSYALSHTGSNYNKNDQMARGQNARSDVESRYKNYV